MECPSNAFASPRGSRLFQKTRWAYVTVVVIFVVHFVGGAQGGCTDKIRRLRRTLSGSSILTKTHAAVQALGDAPRRRGGSLSRRVDGKAAEKCGTMAMYHSLFLDQGGSTTGAEVVEPCKKSDTEGLDAVTFFFTLLTPEEKKSNILQDVFPSDESVTLMSARRGAVTTLRIKTETRGSNVEGENGQSLTVTSTSCLVYSPRQDFLTDCFYDRLKDELELYKLFKVDSLNTVECRFRLKTIQDVLVHPGKEACLPCSGGFVVNRFLAYRATEVTLLQLAQVIHESAKRSPDARRHARIAQLNLSLQLVDVVGRIRLKRVLLPRFTLEHIRLDCTGTLYIQPAAPPLLEVAVSQFGSCRRLDPSKNAWDTARALLYIWCPDEARTLLLATWNYTPDVVLEDTNPARCPSMPEAIWKLIIDIMDKTKGVDEVRYLCDSYKEVESLLREEIREQAEGI